uniref:Cytochrome c oxidase subunit 2 n=1 Tax=Pyrhila pisum TaxID=1550678 RepID=A0A165TX95_PYRPS|nr:cytochrome c oxidase subunit II [Pyrhila pisum]AMY96222.1 cytochrome c oxidase subunit II [Pyrhila pisum]
MATWAFLSFQDAASPLMEQLLFFHDNVMMIIIFITIFLGYMMATVLVNPMINRFMLEHHNLELIWTMFPAIILLFCAFPSLRLLYMLDEVSTPSLTLKTIGHQWYWSYEYSDFMDIEFDSYMIPTDQMSEYNNIRLLDVDNRTTLPMLTQIRIIVTAADVIHSWTVPSLGVKVDAVPGRLNQTSFFMNRPSIFYGQCSEICGTNHSFMPIVIESVSTNYFLNWVLNYSS